MATINIPVRGDIFYYTFTKELDGVIYSFKIHYNLRIDSWILNIGDEVIMRLAGGQNLLGQFYHLNVPPGELRIVDLDGKNTEPNKTNFGDRVVLQYTEAA